MSVALAENPRAVIGGNAPPPTPYELATKAVEDAYGECSLWLDGATVDSQELADGIDNLKKTLAAARKLAEDSRKVEKKPFDDGAAEVQARYVPLITKADLAKTACNKALEPWLRAKAAEIEAAARKAREEADAKRRAAEEALRASDAANLAERAAAEALVKVAKKAEVVANKAERVTATAGGALGRATGLRSYWSAVIEDEEEFERYAWASHRDEMVDFLVTLAKRLIDSGRRDVPGVLAHEEKRAV